MTRAESLPHYTYEEYLRFEEATDAKHEYLDGRILAMAGGTPEHAALAAAVIGLLADQLTGKPCYPLSSDLRVRVRRTGFAAYPDVSVICGPPERDPDDPNAALNPTVLFEVLSESTEAYDRTEKFEHYRQIDSLREYVLVSHRTRLLEHRHREADGSWRSTVAGPGGTVDLESIHPRPPGAEDCGPAPPCPTIPPQR